MRIQGMFQLGDIGHSHPAELAHQSITKNVCQKYIITPT